MSDLFGGMSMRGMMAASACALCLALTPQAAEAQRGETAAQRDAVFSQLLTDPNNRDLMLQYARLSVEMREFEAAAATLERLLDQEPGNSAARAELGIAYFALGNYELAEYHLALAENAGGLSEAQRSEVARYRSEGARRGARSVYSGYVALGYATIDGDGAEAEGPYLGAGLDWRYDLDGPNVTVWVTEAELSSYIPDSDGLTFDTDGRRQLRVRTGPEFRVTGDAFGPRLQPYAEWTGYRLTYSDDPISEYDALAVGLAYQNPHSEFITSFADANIGQRFLVDGDDEFTFYELDLGAVYRPSRDTRIRLTASAAGESREASDVSSLGVRIEAQREFDAPFDSMTRDWVGGGFASLEGSSEDFDFGSTTDEFTSAAGIFLRAFVTQDIYVEGRASRLAREIDSGTVTTDEATTVLSAQIGWEF